jgi:hypothetical protein
MSREPGTGDENSGARAQALRALDEAASDLQQLSKVYAGTVGLYNKLSALYTALEKKAVDLGKVAEQSSASRDQLIQAAKQMQETQMSFNIQYLQLQSQMQNENRTYTAVSNILKTRHDTVKNSISNIR